MLKNRERGGEENQKEGGVEGSKYTTKVLDKPNEEIIQKVIDLENLCFPERWRFTEEYLRNMLENKNNISILLEGLNNQLIGFALLEPYGDTLIKDILEDDPLIKKLDEPAYYLSTVEINPEYQRVGLSSKIFDEIKSEMAAREVNILVLHARIKNGFSQLLDKIFLEKIIKKRYLDKWKYFNYEEPCNFFEIRLD